MVILAGPPGSGKSTIAAEVVNRLNKENGKFPKKAVVLPMDGFHLPRAMLEAMPNSEEAIARRGAPWTFDALGVVAFIHRLHTTRGDLTMNHLAPAFDHENKDPVVDAIEVTGDIDFVIIEGNWLLFNEAPWSEIASFADETWFVDVNRDVALQRVAKRHLQSSIEPTWEQALYRARNNDMVNGDLVRNKLIQPKVTVKSISNQTSLA